MRMPVRVRRYPVLWAVCLLVAQVALLVACGGPTNAVTGQAALATATTLVTDTPSALPSGTPPSTATNTPRPAPTATPRPTPTATPRPTPTATATPRPTPTATSAPPTPTSTPKTVVIQISGFAFSPSSVTIHVGDTVEWENMDSVNHTTTSDNGDPASWDSGALANGATFSFTFTKAGVYAYHCAIHPSMTGTITVPS